MNQNMKIVKSLDLTGMSCPMPIVEVSKEIKKIRSGEILEALTSDPGARTDFNAWAMTSGNEIVQMDSEGDRTRFLIKKVHL